MRVTVFASGSGGNCLLLCNKETCLLIDAGISMRRIGNALARAGRSWQEIDGVLITHEHSDHIFGLKTILKHFDIPLYAPHTLAARIGGMLPDAIARLRVIPVSCPFAVGSLEVSAFHTLHDVDESVGYRIKGEGVFALATDLGCVTEEVLRGLSGADTVMIEANHDLDRLLSGPYPPLLKRRILSERGHLSNVDCASLAALLVPQGTRQIILGHLSKENNLPELALREVLGVLTDPTVKVCCAPEDGFLSMEVGPCCL